MSIARADTLHGSANSTSLILADAHPHNAMLCFSPAPTVSGIVEHLY